MSVPRTINLVLSCATIVGILLAWKASGPYSKARAAYLQFSESAREFEVEDKSKFHLTFVPGDKPLEFEWWVYFPQGFQLKTVLQSKWQGGSSTSGSTSTGQNSFRSPRYGQIRIRLRKVDDKWTVWQSGPGFGGSVGVDSELLDKVDQLSIQIAAEDQPLVFGSTEACQLLNIAASNSDENGFVSLDLGAPAAVDGMRIQRQKNSP